MARRNLRVVAGAGDAPPEKRAKSSIAELPVGVRLSRSAELSLGVAPEYRRLCDSAVGMLRRYRSILEPYERDLAGASAESRVRLSELCTACHELIVPEWRALSEDSLGLVTPLLDEPAKLQAAKRFTEAVLTPELKAGPIWRRAYEKPLGYPGDYQVMRYLYNDAAEGDTAYARLAHGLGLEIGAFVPHRMEMMREAIAMTVEDRAGETGPIRIASIGCGPAREVMDYLESGRTQLPLRFTLVDHDGEALEFAVRNAGRTSGVRDGVAKVHPLQVSVIQLIKDRAVSERLASQHMVYSVGLFDYFGAHVCSKLASVLLDALVPGGLLVIGNMKAHTSIVWPLEFIADWTLNYRTAEEMLALADLADAASAELHTEPTGCDYLLFVRKKG